ncbi:MAG: TatD family hydrolase [Pontibacterium sp.]
MQTEWIDIGVNLADSAFSNDLDAVLERAWHNGVKKLVVTGTSVRDSERAIALCHAHPDSLFCTAGVHPHDAKNFTAGTEHYLRDFYKTDAVVAVGETGLDFNRNFSTPEQQIKAFEKQLELAAECGLPVFLHERDAFKTQFEMLSAHRDHFCRAVAHCFTGTKEALYGYLDLDLYIGITGWVCDERRGGHLHTLLKDIPADRLLLETDAPYLLPRNLKPKPKSRRNEPCHLPHIAAKIADITGKSLEQLSEETLSNSQRFFNLTS